MISCSQFFYIWQNCWNWPLHILQRGQIWDERESQPDKIGNQRWRFCHWSVSGKWVRKWSKAGCDSEGNGRWRLQGFQRKWSLTTSSRAQLPSSTYQFRTHNRVKLASDTNNVFLTQTDSCSVKGFTCPKMAAGENWTTTSRFGAIWKQLLMIKFPNLPFQFPRPMLTTGFMQLE